MTTLARLKFTLLLCLSVASCYAPINVHDVKPPRPTPVAVSEASLKTASKSSRINSLALAASTLETLRIAHDRLAKGDASALQEYNYLTARFVEQIRAAGAKPWMREIELPSSGTRYVVRGSQPDDLDVEKRDFIAADSLEFTGQYAETQSIQEGVGAPLLAVLTSPATLDESFDSKFRYRSTTALVHFKGNKATVQLADPYDNKDVSIGGHSYPLHSNFSANVSYGLSKTRIDKLGLIRLLNPSQFDETCRISRLQPYDPDRIPVLMVHGLDSTPATWTPLYFKLMQDPRIRETYQFWVFSYSSGYPYPYAGALLRKELDRMNSVCPNHKSMVIIGHSMGSLISRLMVSDVGDSLWKSYFGTPPATTELNGGSRDLLEDSLVFDSRPEINRAIFVAGPHRGAELASSWIGRLGSKLVKAPGFIADTRDSMVNVIKADPAAMALNRAPNSIDTLAPNNRFILEINKYPVAKRIPFHSIMGDRGKGNTPDSSDGFVSYWSSHLDGAVSEKIVPSDHSAHIHPEGIEEIHRILREHAGLN